MKQKHFIDSHKAATAFFVLALMAVYGQWQNPTAWIYLALHAPGWYLALCIRMYVFGVFTHFSADMQKFVALNLRPEHLISDGMFTRLRNVNYFGELLIYTGFGLLAMHWIPVVVLLIWVLLVWLPRMRKKDRSLSRYAGFGEYKARSKLFIPFLF